MNFGRTRMRTRDRQEGQERNRRGAGERQERDRMGRRDRRGFRTLKLKSLYGFSLSNGV